MSYYEVVMIQRGKKVKYGVYAESKKDATSKAKLKHHGIVLKAVPAAAPLEDVFKKYKDTLVKSLKRSKIDQDALIAAIRQLAVMSNAGISIHDALKEISSSSQDENLKTILNKIADDINSGHSLSGAMEHFRFELGNLTLAMIELGERTGNMAEALYSLADMLEEIRRNIIKFKKAMAYPRNVMIAMAVAFTVLISYVVPQFKTIFEELGANLPLPTIILLKLEFLFNNYGPYVLATLFVTFMTIRYFIENFYDVKRKFHALLLKTYLIKNIIMYSTLNRFTLVFSELVGAGISIADALDSATSMIDNVVLKEKLSTVRASVEKGSALNQGLKDTGLFENMIIQMITAGESSGQLDAMLKNVTDYYKMRFDAIIDNLSEAVEPIMLFLIAGMVILLALGIFMPMWDMGNAVQGRT
ncbi:MAG: type II secretion system F family protein [Helicobacteraceae bacterium]|nr:type II secretion system F family protein [Helicobacteraceae bacterium]